MIIIFTTPLFYLQVLSFKKSTLKELWLNKKKHKTYAKKTVMT